MQVFNEPEQAALARRNSEEFLPVSLVIFISDGDIPYFYELECCVLKCF